MFFLGYLIGGWFVVDDYGITFDEAVQRRQGHVTMEYVLDRFGVDHPPLATEGWGFSEYGMVFQLVATAIELQQEAIDDPYRYYRIRHVLGYLLFAVALWSVHRTLRLRWPDRAWYPLLGAALLLLSPRIFAHAFFNPKDHILLVAYAVATYTLARFLHDRSWKSLAWHTLACALALNTRFPAFAVVGATVAVLLWEQLTERPGNLRRLGQLAVFLPGTLLLMLPFFPYLWADTGERLSTAVAHMSAYDWIGTNLFFGEAIEARNLPAHYIPAWIGISTPLIYLFFILCGLLLVTWRTLSRLPRARLWSDYAGQLDFVQLGLSIGPVLVVIALQSTLYNGWRHLHFVYPGLLFVAITGFDALRQWVSRVFPILLAVGMVLTARTMIRMHPLQQVYFNELIAEPHLMDCFELDYWGSGFREALLQLAEQIPEGETRHVFCQNWGCKDNIRALPPGARDKIVAEQDWGNAHFVATSFFYPQEKTDVRNRVLIFAKPAVELTPQGNLIIGIYYNLEE